MTPEECATLHQAAFRTERPWQVEEFTTLIAQRFVSMIEHPHGFALTRTVARESELLTLAVDPLHHGRGIGTEILRRWLDSLAKTADTAFLEVADDNHAAKHLYARLGFSQIARRKGYYARTDAASVDAIVMRLPVSDAP
ncbi:MAG: GNAT family N-acetyltransferase [Sulfitobacter sp.]